MNLQLLFIVMAGGALGAGARFLISHYSLLHFGDRLPWGTLAANLIGALAAGFFYVWLEQRGDGANTLRAFILVGILGGLTTFSSLMLEMLVMQRAARMDAALLYLSISLTGGLAAIWCGARVAAALKLAS